MKEMGMMSEENASDQDIDRRGDLPAAHQQAGRTEGSRLPNLGKLYHVPTFALRRLLDDRGEGRSFTSLGQGELVRKADELVNVTEADIEELYENYRYGRRPSFYLYLLPNGLNRPDSKELQALLDRLAAWDRFDLPPEMDTNPAPRDETSPDQVIVLGEEDLDDFFEIRFRYYVPHRFLNVDEQPDQVLQSRYGFLWLDLELGYMAVLSRDERTNRMLTRALSKCLRAIPLPARFPKELLDKHFSIEKAKRLSYYDPSTGVRRSISGYGLWQRFKKEILEREQLYTRPSTLYTEEVAEGVTSGLGVTATSGKIYLTRTLPTSVVRAWARRRLPDLMRDLQELRASQPDSFSRSLDTVNRMRLSASGRATIINLVEALLETEREDLSSTTLPQTALEIYEALAGKYFSPYLRSQCSTCDETAELCPHCESQNIEFDGKVATCEQCRTTISDKELVSLRCMNGHITNASLAEAWNIAPNHWLQKRMARIFEEIGQSWEEGNDYFHIEGNTLYRLRRSTTRRDKLPPVIQNYISNFWDPVTGQVHAGRGDIIIGSPLWETQQQGYSDGRQKIVSYQNFSLVFQGSAATGYTVEASVSGGDSVPPQPLILPGDRALRVLLDTVRNRIASNGNVQSAGEALFNAAYPPRVRELWARIVQSLREDEGLRVTLQIEPLELMALPWELMFGEEYIGLRQRFPIVRVLDLPQSTPPFTKKRPLRVLMAVAQPPSSRQAGANAELAKIRGSLAQLPNGVEVDIVQPASGDELLAKLRQGYNVLHFVGRGKVQGQEGYLLLDESEEGAGLAAASQLGQMVVDGGLQLVILSSHGVPVTERHRCLGSLAYRLVRSGLPAAIAMQLDVLDHSAMAFSREFYSALADGWPVDAAVQEGRRSVLGLLGHDPSSSVDWAIPTIYTRTPDSIVLGIQKPEQGGMMRRKDELSPIVTYTPTFYGPVQGPVHTGSGDLHIESLSYGLDAKDLNGLFDALRKLVHEESPPELQEKALFEVRALEEAIQQDDPDLGTMESVLNWFKRNIPKLAGAVTSVILHPIVGQIVEAAGDIAAERFRALFGR
jgi:hypothetical protein